MAVQDQQSLFTYDLSTVRCAAQIFQQMIPQMEQECQRPQLKQFFGSVTGAIQQHITRIEECFRLLGEQPMTVSCHVAEGFRQEHDEFMQQGPTKDIVDLYNVALGIEMGHYMVGCYRSLLDGALGAGSYQCQSILDDSLADVESMTRQCEELGDRVTASFQGVDLY